GRAGGDAVRRLHGRAVERHDAAQRRAWRADRLHRRRVCRAGPRAGRRPRAARGMAGEPARARHRIAALRREGPGPPGRAALSRDGAPRVRAPMTRAAAEARLREAATLHGAGRLDEAAAIYADILAREPDNAGAHHGLGLVALRRGELAQAAECLERAVAL